MKKVLQAIGAWYLFQGVLAIAWHPLANDSFTFFECLALSLIVGFNLGVALWLILLLFRLITRGQRAKETDDEQPEWDPERVLRNCAIVGVAVMVIIYAAALQGCEFRLLESVGLIPIGVLYL